MKRNAVGRAFTAADLVNGVVTLVRPTITQASWLAGVSCTYVDAALAIDDPDLRTLILEGHVPLIGVPVPKPTPRTFAESARWRASYAAHNMREFSDAELAEVAREIGIDRVWDAMVVPNIKYAGHSRRLAGTVSIRWCPAFFVS
jgi:hypothetical protein